MTSVTSYRVTPQGIIVSASTYRPCPIFLILEATRYFPEKDLPEGGSAPTTPVTMTAELYARAYKYRSITRRYIGTHARECTHHHHQVRCNKTHRATYGGLELTYTLIPIVIYDIPCTV